MLKHRVSNAGSHGPPQSVIRNVTSGPAANQNLAPGKVQPPVQPSVPKPPRVYQDSVPQTLQENCDTNVMDQYQQHNAGASSQHGVSVQGVTSVNNSSVHSQSLNGQGYNQQQLAHQEHAYYQEECNFVQQQQQYSQQLQSQPEYNHGRCYNDQEYYQTQTDNNDVYRQTQSSQGVHQPADPSGQNCYQAQTYSDQSNNRQQYSEEQTYPQQLTVTNGQSCYPAQVQGASQHGAPGQRLAPSEGRAGAYNHVEGVVQVDVHGGSNIETAKAKEGIRLINEKYDSLGNISSSPQLSPMSSPGVTGEPMSFTDIIMSQKFREGVSEQDTMQVDTFYRSHKSDVYVCNCLANMYTGSVKSSATADQWTFSATGIPLFLLDTGEHHRERKLYMILAEKGTGFTLWRDVIDNLTNYKTPNANFHTMHLSKDHTKLAGFSFDEADKAREFYRHLESLTSDPNDELLKIGKSKKKKSVKEKKKKVKLPKKTEISQPCCFVHVTKLERPASEADDIGKVSSDTNKQSIDDSNKISAPFNFQHVTATSGTGTTLDAVSSTGSLSQTMGSKLTLTSSSSVDSGLSDDRSTRTVNS